MNLPGISDLLRQCEMDCVNNTNMMHCIAYCVPHGLTRNTISVLLLVNDNIMCTCTVCLKKQGSVVVIMVWLSAVYIPYSWLFSREKNCGIRGYVNKHEPRK